MFDRATRIERQFKKVAQNIKPFELQVLDDEPPLTERDLVGELYGRGRSSRFLGYYSHQGILRAFEAYGILQLLRDRGFPDVHLELNLSDSTHHRMRLFAGRQPSPDNLLIDFAAHLGTGADLPPGPPTDRIELLVIDWLMLQNPHAAFKPHEALPGQNFPGLGIGLEIGAMIAMISQRLKLDGTMVIPAWFHNAVFYSQRYHFVEPVAEGRFRALLRDTRHLSVADVSWAFELDCVLEQSADHAAAARQEQVLHWQGRSQVWPLSEGLEAWFRAPAWLGICDGMRDACQFEIDEVRLRQLRG